MRNEWFTNRGHLIQTVLAGTVAVIAGVKAWPDVRGNAVLSAGAVLFYLVIAMAVVTTALLVRGAETGPVLPESQPVGPLEFGVLKPGFVRVFLMSLHSEFDVALGAYRRLIYDDPVGGRYPFAPSSWPDYGREWSNTHVELYCLKRRMDTLIAQALILKFFNWPDWSDSKLPRTSPDTVAVDFLAEMESLTRYIESKIPPPASFG